MSAGWQFPVVLSVMPDVWARLLEDHCADASGTCRACRSQVRPAERWPCSLYRAAAQARRIAAG